MGLFRPLGRVAFREERFSNGASLNASGTVHLPWRLARWADKGTMRSLKDGHPGWTGSKYLPVVQAAARELQRANANLVACSALRIEFLKCRCSGSTAWWTIDQTKRFLPVQSATAFTLLRRFLFRGVRPLGRGVDCRHLAVV